MEQAAPPSIVEDLTTKEALTRSQHEDEIFAPAKDIDKEGDQSRQQYDEEQEVAAEHI